MKRHNALLIFLAGVLSVLGYPPSPLMEETDKAWVEGRESEIPIFIDKRLKKAPTDTTALFLGHSYFLMWEFDFEKAAQYQKRLEDIIYPIRDSITDGKEKKQFEEWLVTALPTVSDSQPAISDAQRKEMQKCMHELFRNQFPGTLDAQINTKILSRYLKEASTNLKSDYNAFQKRKVADIKKLGVENMLNKAGILGEGDRGEIPKEKWPEDLSSLEPIRVFSSPEKMTIWFFRMASTYDGVILHKEEEFSGDSPHTKYTDFGGGVVWFHSSQ